jgi:hypothetical protein
LLTDESIRSQFRSAIPIGERLSGVGVGLGQARLRLCEFGAYGTVIEARQQVAALDLFADIDPHFDQRQSSNTSADLRLVPRRDLSVGLNSLRPNFGANVSRRNGQSGPGSVGGGLWFDVTAS